MVDAVVVDAVVVIVEDVFADVDEFESPQVDVVGAARERHVGHFENDKSKLKSSWVRSKPRKSWNKSAVDWGLRREWKWG